MNIKVVNYTKSFSLEENTTPEAFVEKCRKHCVVHNAVIRGIIKKSSLLPDPMSKKGYYITISMNMKDSFLTNEKDETYPMLITGSTRALNHFIKLFNNQPHIKDSMQIYKMD